MEEGGIRRVFMRWFVNVCVREMEVLGGSWVSSLGHWVDSLTINWDKSTKGVKMSSSVLDPLRLSACGVSGEDVCQTLGCSLWKLGWEVRAKDKRCWQCTCGSWNPETQEERVWKEHWAEDKTLGKLSEERIRCGQRGHGFYWTAHCPRGVIL